MAPPRKAAYAPSPAPKPTNTDYEDFSALSNAFTNVLGGPDVLVDDKEAITVGNLVSEEFKRTQNHEEEEVPHYLAKTVIRVNRPFMILFTLSVLLSIVYFVVRCVFLAQVTEEYRNNTASYSLAWSIVVMVAELGGFVLTHIGQQMFWKQDTIFTPMTVYMKRKMMSIVEKKGKLQRIHVMVCTYSEPAETVENCVRKILNAPAPCYAEKLIYIGDDGASVKKYKEVSEAKLAFVQKMREEGHKNVFYVGDRVKLPSQLNGKSSNLNHMILQKIYPHVQKSTDVSWKDILMVMDCDHMLEPSYFQKCCAVMLDKNTAVCLVPQWFHNHIEPDFFDNTNTNFMFRLMPYYFGAGCCFITGTNVMVRARPCFMACRFDENPHGHEQDHQLEGGTAHRCFFSETLVAEDIDLGSRIHTLGYKSVFLCEVLALGEVPLPPRDIWKQRSRWAKAAHLYILDKDSVFWRAQQHMNFWQKSLYCIPLVLHFIIIWCEPIMVSMPIICIVGNVCPYGINSALWTTHFLNLAVRFFISTWGSSWQVRRAALYAQTSSRLLFFVNCKAVLNTIMIYTGWKKAGAFKVTAKAAPVKKIAEGIEAPSEDGGDEANANANVPPSFWGYAEQYEEMMEREALALPAPPGQPIAEAQIHRPSASRTLPIQSLPTCKESENSNAEAQYESAPMASVSVDLKPVAAKPEKKEAKEPFRLYHIHRALSNITNLRSKAMPFEGTLDFWVLMGITAINVIAFVKGFIDVNKEGKLFNLGGSTETNLRLIAVVFAMVEAAPGVLFIWYVFFRELAPWTLKLWVPLVIGCISILVIVVEVRVGLQYWGYTVGLKELPDCTFGNCQL